MIDWLVKRLTPRKSRENRWVDLAASMQQAWEAYFDPALSRLERLRSYYQADSQDLKRLIREMGDYFAEDLPGDRDLPIAVSWRRLELEYKDLELILTSVFRRNYGNLPVSWLPIFAPVDAEYGSSFTVAEGPWPERKNVPPEGLFLTSRGRLGVDYGAMLARGLLKQAFLERAVPLLKRTKPLHIVYDGPLFYIRFDLPAQAYLCNRLLHWERERAATELTFSTIGGRYDFTSADVRPVDNASLACVYEREAQYPIHFIALESVPWRMDWTVPEGVQWIPLDYVMPGSEGVSVHPFSQIYGEVEQFYPLPVQLDIDQRGERELRSFDFLFSTLGARYDFTSADTCPVDNASLACVYERETRRQSISFFDLASTGWHMDWRFPEGLSWIPLDYVMPGSEGVSVHPFSQVYSETDRLCTLPVETGVDCCGEHEIRGSELAFTPIGGRYDFTNADVRAADDCVLRTTACCPVLRKRSFDIL